MKSLYYITKMKSNKLPRIFIVGLISKQIKPLEGK